MANTLTNKMQQSEFFTENESELICTSTTTTQIPMVSGNNLLEPSSPSARVRQPPSKSPPSSVEPVHLELTGEAALSLPLPCTDISKETRSQCPDFEIGESQNRTSGAENKPQSEFTLPGSECLIDTRKRQVAVFVPHVIAGQRIQTDGSYVITRSTSSIEYFREGLRGLKPVYQGKKSTELLLFHMFRTDHGRPLIGSQLVSENELYQPLCDSGFDRVSVFQLSLCTQLEGTPLHHAMVRGSESVDNPFMDVDFYLFSTEAKNWRSLQEAVAKVATSAWTEEGLTSDWVADELVRSCPELTLRQRSGVRSGGRVASLPEVCEPSVVQPSQQNCEIISSQPMQPDTDDLLEPEFSYHSTSTFRQSLLPALPADNYNGFTQMKRNASLGIIVHDYRQCRPLLDRFGAERDAKLIYDISRKFRCYADNIYCMPNKSGAVSKQDIRDFIQDVSERLTPWKEELQNLYLFVSSHGNQNGIVTSCREAMSLAELVQPLQKVCEHTNLIYQPCRGDVPLRKPGVPRLRGWSLPDDDTADCSLPPAMTNVSAMLASLPGFSNSWHCNEGSFMLLSLSQVVHAPDMAGRVLNMEKLTHLTAAKLCDIVPKYKNEVPMHFIMRGSCHIRIAEDDFPLRNEPAIPEVMKLPSFTLRLRNN